MPAAETELYGTTWARRAADLTGLTEFRLSVGVYTAGYSTAVLRGLYSTDGGTSWSNLEHLTTTGDVSISTTGLRVGTWVALDPAAMANVQLCIAGLAGNSTADPVFRYIGIELR